MTRTKVVPCYWLHSLTDTKNNHDKEECDAVDNAVGGYGKVTSVLGKTFIDEDDHKARAELHTEWGHTDREDILHDAFLQSVNTRVEMKEVVLIRKHFYNIDERNDLCEDCGICRSLDTHSKGEDEQRVENRIYHDCRNSCNHGYVRMSCASQSRIHTQEQMRYDIA